MRPEHTALPWTFQETNSDSIAPAAVILWQGHIIARCWKYELSEEFPAVANAEYIVRAANCHDELVAALDDTVPAMRDEYERHNGSKKTGCLCAYCDRYRMVTYLLAKARGES